MHFLCTSHQASKHSSLCDSYQWTSCSNVQNSLYNSSGLGNNEIIIIVKWILCDSGLLSLLWVWWAFLCSMRFHEGFGLGCGKETFSFVFSWFPSFNFFFNVLFPLCFYDFNWFFPHALMWNFHECYFFHVIKWFVFVINSKGRI